MLTPDHKSCVNFTLLFKTIFIDFPLDIPLGFFKKCQNLIGVLICLHEQLLALQPVIGDTFRRWEPKLKAIEYLAYVGSNEVLQIHDVKNLGRSCEGRVFGKPCVSIGHLYEGVNLDVVIR